MQLQVSFEMVSLVGGVGGAECCWEVLDVIAMGGA